jgi:hypothetical protein
MNMIKYTIESSMDSFEVVRWADVKDGIRSGTVVFTTTDPDEAETMCDEYTIGELADYYYTEPESEFDRV